MRSARPGTNTPEVEFANVSQPGFWLLIERRELFLPFDKSPRFRDGLNGYLTGVEQSHRSHLYWPDLDVDLAAESIESPERFPLVSRARPKKALQGAQDRG